MCRKRSPGLWGCLELRFAAGFDSHRSTPESCLIVHWPHWYFGLCSTQKQSAKSLCFVYANQPFWLLWLTSLITALAVFSQFVMNYSTEPFPFYSSSHLQFYRPFTCFPSDSPSSRRNLVRLIFPRVKLSNLVLSCTFLIWVTVGSFLGFGSQHSCKWSKAFRLLSVQVLAVTPRGPRALSTFCIKAWRLKCFLGGGSGDAVQEGPCQTCSISVCLITLSCIKLFISLLTLQALIFSLMPEGFQ